MSTTINTKNPTKLGRILSGSNASGPAPAPGGSTSSTKLGAILSIRRGEVVDVPILGRVYFQLVSSRRWQEIAAETQLEIRRLEVDTKTTAGMLQHEHELAMRVLAESAREPEDPSRAFGSLEDWGQLDNDVVSAAWQAFGDVRERLDPATHDLQLTSDDAAMIEAAAKKRDAGTLRSFGVTKLALWLARPDTAPDDAPSEA